MAADFEDTNESSVIKLSRKEQRCLDYMNEHGSITPKDAESKLSDHRLAVTISGLRNKGYNIDTLRMETTNKYGEPTWYGKYVFGADSE